jgi:hypothetical protein
VLEGVETQIREVRRLGVIEDADDAALVVKLVVLEPALVHWALLPD